MTYNSGFTGGLNVLGPPPSGQQPTYLNADLVDSNLAGLEAMGTNMGFVKSGYVFQYNPVGTFPLISYYSFNADPQNRGSSGQRSFFTDDPLVIRANATAQATAADNPI
jgi:hypothetical protein